MIKKINDLEIKDININKKNNKKQDIIHDKLINVKNFLGVIIGMKGSGKTVLVDNIIQIASTKKTKVYIFSSTINFDSNWINIKNKLNKYNIEFEAYENIYDDNKNNILEQIFNNIKENVEEEKDKIKKANKYYSKFLFVIDDLAEILKDKILQKIIFKHRHYLTSIILVSQYYKSLSVGIRTNADFLCIYGNIGDDALKKIYDEHINNNKLLYEDFLNYYKQITEQKYNFMYINNLDIRKNLNYQIILN